MKTPHTTGRPPKTAPAISMYETEIYQLLRNKLPERFTDSRGRISTARLVEEGGFAPWTIYRWFKGENISRRSADTLIEISAKSDCERKGALTLDLLTKFIIGA